MHSFLRAATASTHRDIMRARLEEIARNQAEEQDEENIQLLTQQDGDENDADERADNELPPLISEEDFSSNATRLRSNKVGAMPKLTNNNNNTTSPSSSTSFNEYPNGGLHPSPARFAFRPNWKRCVPDYSCCLRYQMKLATCCMPRRDEFTFVPSFQWLQSRFYPLHADRETLEFLHTCDDNFYQQGWMSSWGLRVGVLKPLLRRCMAHTDVNGLLGCGQMFLVSSEQVRILLKQSIPSTLRGQVGIEWPWSLIQSETGKSRHLDVGAGDGHITEFVAKFFTETVATEVASQMIKRLRSRGFETIHTGDLDVGLPLSSPTVGDGFDCITLFNVLDRCSHPRTLLRQLRDRMRSPSVTSPHNTSRLILSVPLPLDPSVEVGTTWIDPSEKILNHSRSARDFESSLCALGEMLLSLGFNIESVSRIPYLSQGDTWRPFYVLDASLWVLSPRYEKDPLPIDELNSNSNSHSHSQVSGHSHDN